MAGSIFMLAAYVFTLRAKSEKDRQRENPFCQGENG